MEAKRREGESVGSLLFRFTKKIQRGGVLKEARKRRFYDRTLSQRKRRVAAIRREEKKTEFQRKKKLGLL